MKIRQGYDKFLESCGEDEPGYEKSWDNGYESCKEEIIKLINQEPSKEYPMGHKGGNYARLIKDIENL